MRQNHYLWSKGLKFLSANPSSWKESKICCFGKGYTQQGSSLSAGVLFQKVESIQTLTHHRAHSELNASPRNPNVSTFIKSPKSLSFDVWCFRAKIDTGKATLQCTQETLITRAICTITCNNSKPQNFSHFCSHCTTWNVEFKLGFTDPFL